MSADSLESRAAQVRAFNRFYTRQIGLLRDRFLDSPFSLTEVRILYELAHREGLTASDLCRDLGFNAGYMSRVVSGFVRKGLVAKTRSAEDGRAVHLELTDKGRQIYGPLDAASQRDITALLEALPETDQRRLIAAMREIRSRPPPTSCATRNPAISAGSSAVRPSCTPKSTAGTRNTKLWWRKSPLDTSANSNRAANAAG